MLGKFLLCDPDNILLFIEQNGAGTGGSLVQCEDITWHGSPLLLDVYKRQQRTQQAGN